jgi:hypothetical protein
LSTSVHVHVFDGSSGRTSATRRDVDRIGTAVVCVAPAVCMSAVVPKRGVPPMITSATSVSRAVTTFFQTSS